MLGAPRAQSSMLEGSKLASVLTTHAAAGGRADRAPGPHGVRLTAPSFMRTEPKTREGFLPRGVFMPGADRSLARDLPPDTRPAGPSLIQTSRRHSNLG